MCHLVLFLGDDVVVRANLAKELKAAAIKAGHDGIPATYGSPLSSTLVSHVNSHGTRIVTILRFK